MDRSFITTKQAMEVYCEFCHASVGQPCESRRVYCSSARGWVGMPVPYTHATRQTSYVRNFEKLLLTRDDLMDNYEI